MSDFPRFDAERTPSIEVIDGMPTIISDRTVLIEHEHIEPLNETFDQFASIPLRTVHTSGAGFSFELGPFSLDSKDVAKLQNALADHINSLPGEFRWRSA